MSKFYTVYNYCVLINKTPNARGSHGDMTLGYRA
jgi:hypothetical protein